MKFTCPKCYETFSARKGKSSIKLMDIATLNEAFGHTCKVSLADLARIFLRRSAKPWTRKDFHAAIEKKTGVRYSHAHAFATLKKFKSNPPSVVMVDGVPHVAFSGPIASVITSHPGQDNSKLVHKVVACDPAKRTEPLINPVRIVEKSAIP